ncbi:MAG: ribosomal protein S18-alanine N-acetyltransferase [Acidobacteriaceae bacterium]|nr:ribosomal protein S18-alanine N-acetyltransferase [Acidobacteriaceae bacterium]
MFKEDTQRTTLVVEAAGIIQGFIVGRAVGREWEIENIAVANAVRRKGLGLALLNGLIEVVRAQNSEAVFLEVRESNRAARALYEKAGFVGAGRRTRYYRNPDEDAMIYRLLLE